MPYRTDSMLEPAAFADKRDALWRIAFDGGPLDGGVALSASVPAVNLELPSELAGDCGEAASVTAERVAHYRCKSIRLGSVKTSPVVILHYEFRGSAVATVAQPLWRRGLAALARWQSMILLRSWLRPIPPFQQER